MDGTAKQLVEFVYDAPQFYDFEQGSHGAPADEWFDTAPDGPGYKRETRQQEGKENTLHQQPEVKPNIVTSWGDSNRNTAGTKRSADKTATSGDPTAHQGLHKARRVSKDQFGPRTEPPVTRSISRLRTAMTPVPEKSASCRPAEVQFNSALEGPRKGCVSAPRERLQPREHAPRERAAAVAADQKLRQVLQPKVTRPACSTKPLTLPDEVELHTSRRLRSANAAEVAASPFKSLAEKVKEFQSKTPSRFKTKVTKPAPSKPVLGVTVPKEPVLWTSTRNRPTHFKPREEELLEEAQKELQKAFHAKPVDPTILTSSGQLGVPRVEKKGPTEPAPFSLRSDARAQKRKSVALGPTHEPPARNLRSSQLKRSILDGPTFQPIKEAHQLTIPKSPFLHTKQRHHDVPHDKPKVEFHARPLPDFSKAGRSLLQPPPKEPTHPKPFQLATEVRGQQHQTEMQQKLEAEARAAALAAQVVAKPLPHSIDVPAVPPKPEPKMLTIADPFNLKSEARHADYVEKRLEELQQEEEELRRAAEVKAAPMWVGRPYVPKPSDRALTVPDPVHLATEDRAPERAAFDDAVQQKLKEQEEQKRQEEQRRLEQEVNAAKEYRRSLRFQAREMPKFDQPFYTMPSKRPLTLPKTPNFASKKLKQSKGG